MIQPAFQGKVEIKVSLAANSPVIQIYTTAGELLFNITLPPQELLNVSAPNHTVTTINENSMGVFKGGKAVHKNGENILFVSPKGQIYTEKNLIGSYRYNTSQQSITYILQDGALSNDKIEITLKVQPFQK